MLDERIAKRYAKALFELAMEGDALEEIKDDFKKVVAILNENSDLNALFMEGNYVSCEFSAAVAEIFSSCNPLTINFLGLLVEKRRTNLIFAIKDRYNTLLDEHLGYGDASVLTAFLLSSEEEEKIKTHLEYLFHRKMRLSVEVDESLIAGVRIQYKDYVMDTSYKTKLKRLKKKIESDELEVTGTDEH